jgi:hypothetical protein
MATQTYTIRNSVDGSYDTFHWDPATFTSITMQKALEDNLGTTAGKKDSHRDTSRATAEAR